MAGNRIIAPTSLDGFFRTAQSDYTTKGYRELAFIEHRGLQSRELNDSIYYQYLNNRYLFEGVYADGDILRKGGYSYQDGQINFSDFRIFSSGYPVDVPPQNIVVGQTGTVIVGILVEPQYITEIDDPDLLDPAPPPAENSGKEGAARLKIGGSWALSTVDMPPGAIFYPIYTFINGEIYNPDVIDPQTSKIIDRIADYDSAANGPYVSAGTRIVFKAKVNIDVGDPPVSTPFYQFYMEAGAFNVQGYRYHFSDKRTFNIPDMTSDATQQNEPIQFFSPLPQKTTISVNTLPAAVTLNYIRIITPSGQTFFYQFTSDATPTNTEIVTGLLAAYAADGSTKPFTMASQAGGTQILIQSTLYQNLGTILTSGYLTANTTQQAVSDYYTTDFADIESVTSITGPKNVLNEAVTHSAAVGGTDALGQGPLVSVTRVSSGPNGTGTIYATPADYLVSGNSISWSPGGAEPTGGATYYVDYVIQSTVNTGVVSTDHTQVQLTGFKDNSSVLVTYKYWLKRRDVVMLAKDGSIYLVTGIPGYVNPPAKNVIASNDLPIAEVLITKYDDPVIDFVYPPAFTMREVQEIQQKLEEVQFNLARDTLSTNVTAQDPLNNKVNLFVDPLLDDSLVDYGLTNTAAIYMSAIHLPVTPTIVSVREGLDTITVPYTHTLFRSQTAWTKSRKINEFLNPGLPPAALISVLPTCYRYVAKTATLAPIESIQQIQSARTVNSVRGNTVTTTAATSASGSSQPIISTTDIQKSDWDTAVLNSRAPAISTQLTASGFFPNEICDFYFEGVNITNSPADNAGKFINFAFTIPNQAGAPGSNEIKIVGRETAHTATCNFEIIPQQRLTITPQRTTITIPPPPTVATNQGESRGGNGSATGNRDPLAQTYTPERDCYFTKVEVVFQVLPTTPVIMPIGPTQSGTPDPGGVLATAQKLPSECVLGPAKTTFQPDQITFTQGATEHAFYFISTDSVGELRVAQLGFLDQDTGQRININPFLEGVLLNSSNQNTWSAIQDEDMQFWLYRAAFDTTTSHTVTLGNVDLAAEGLSNITDLMLLTAARNHAQTSLEFHIELTDRLVGGVPETHIVEPYQNISIAAYSGHIAVKAVMSTTSEYVTPEIDATVQLMCGVVATTATYTSRQFTITGQSIRVFVEAFEPSGADLRIFLEKGNTFIELTRDTNYAVLKNNGFIEYRYTYPVIQLGLNVTRLRMQLDGTNPTLRPMGRAPRLYVADVTM